MTNRATTILIVLVILLGIGAYFTFRSEAPVDNNIPPGTINNGGNNNGGNNSTTTQQFTSTNVRVFSPLPNASIASPVTITGEARLYYFEGSFPVRIVDANNKQLGIGIAQAEGDWMTTNFVRFSAPVSFSAPTTATGFIVFQKDNPSGLPENDEEVRMPIRFSNVVSQTRDIKLYFYNSQNDLDANGNVICSAKGLVTINRTIPHSNTPIQDAIKELLKGPSALEKLTLSGTEFPLAGVSLTSASLSGGVLTLAMADPQNRTSGGSCKVNVLRAQIEATAKQFGGVNSVRYSPNTLFQP